MHYTWFVHGREARPARLGRRRGGSESQRRETTRTQLGAGVQDGIDVPIESEGAAQVVQTVVDTVRPACASA